MILASCQTSLGIVLLLAYLIGGVSHAQGVSQPDVAERQYPDAYFAKFNPQTAWDMVTRIPGFTIDAGDDIRGFGAGAGNVLIDGARPSSKSGGIEEALKRVLARSVARIELIRGTASASEASGQAVVANVITEASDATGRWTVEFERSPAGDLNLMSEVVYAQSVGPWLTSSQIDVAREQRPLDGTRTSRDAEGLVTFVDRESSPSDARRFAFASQAERPAAGGSLAVNGRISHRPLSVATLRRGFDGGLRSGVPDEQLIIDLERDSTDLEIGVDWSRSISQSWNVKFLSLSSLEQLTSQSIVNRERPTGAWASTSLFDSDQEALESILRGTLTHANNESRRTELGAEITYNRLDSELTLIVDDADGPREIEVPAADVVVDEIRGEAFANAIWQIDNRLSFEAGLAVEYSRISVAGDARNRRSFTFIKPAATVVYTARDGVQFRASATREVGQLSFSDFAASASAADDRFLGGNPDLGPDQANRLALAMDLRAEAYGALNIEVFHEWRENILEQVVLPSGVAGLDNAGSARVWGASISADVALDRIMPGGLLGIEAQLLDSRFDDPLTLSERAVSSIDEADVYIELRQDRVGAPIAWGVWYRAPLEGPFYFADEISLNRDSRSFGAFLETTRLMGVKMTLKFSGLGNETFSRQREFFTPDRAGVFSGSELIRRGRGAFVTFTVAGQF